MRVSRLLGVIGLAVVAVFLIACAVLGAVQQTELPGSAGTRAGVGSALQLP